MGKRRARRQFSADFKRRVVEQTHAAGTSVSVVARRHDINANLFFRWRDDPRYAFKEQKIFLPVEIGVGIQELTPAAQRPEMTELGIWIVGDVRLVVKGGHSQAGSGVARIC